MAATKRQLLAQRRKRQEEFIHALAEFLADNQAMKSVWLEAGHPMAKEWARLRSRSPVFGYPTVEEVEATLTRFLLEPNT